jgi:hypothetical protein
MCTTEARVFGGIRERLRGDVVGSCLDLVQEGVFDLSVELDRHCRAARQCPESRCQPALREDRRMDPARDLHESVEDRAHVRCHAGQLLLERVSGRRVGFHHAQLQPQ